MQWTGKVALVMGGGSGIGRATCEIFAERGGAVAAADINEKAARTVAEAITARGGKAVACPCDVSRWEQVEAAVATARRVLGRLDVVINCAGVLRCHLLEETPESEWNEVLSVNLTGMFLCTREAVRKMILQGPRPEVSRATGKIICMSSVHQRIPWAGHANYAASKGGVSLFMQSVAQEVAPQRIRVNAIAPGAIMTPINRAAWETPEALRSLLRLIPYGRIGQPEDIGKVAVWLASDDSDYVHGQTIFVDGGMTLYPEFARGG